ncbi:MAG: hypothetical protein WD491_03675 [Balneolales bacterium]
MHQNTLTDDLKLPEKANLNRPLLIVGVIGLLISAVGLFTNTQQFFFSYLVSFTFVASISLGALFWVMLQFVTRSNWSVVFRRIPETLAANLYLLPILFIPLLFGLEYLYEWLDPTMIAEDELTQHKQPYLNATFFVIRNIIYFSVWSFLGYKIYKNSTEMDESADWDIDVKQRTYSAPGLLLFAFTVAFASFDWLMSLDSHWFSTMFGVYFFAMSFQAILAVVILLCLYLQKQGILLNTIKMVHINDLGILLFGFTVFYAYIAFSQFFLIYYANIPEETMWYYYRLQGTWSFFTYLFLIGRFIIPFILLLGKRAKTNRTLLTVISIGLIVLHFIELHWIAMPVLHDNFSFHWLDVATIIGLTCIVLGLFFRQFGKNNMVPKNDPLVLESLNKH